MAANNAATWCGIPDDQRLELRRPIAPANPYLAAAAVWPPASDGLERSAILPRQRRNLYTDRLAGYDSAPAPIPKEALPPFAADHVRASPCQPLLPGLRKA